MRRSKAKYKIGQFVTVHHANPVFYTTDLLTVMEISRHKPNKRLGMEAEYRYRLAKVGHSDKSGWFNEDDIFLA